MVLRTLNVNIQWIDKPEPLNGTLMIIFTDVPEIAEIKPGTKKGTKTLKQYQADGAGERVAAYT